MVFMADSERAAELALAHHLDVGLHLNLTEVPSSPDPPSKFLRHHEKVASFLSRSRFSPVLYHPGLTDSFGYLVAAQLEEFVRLYGAAPDRIDGHHHMHLSANVILDNLLPVGTIVRRNFTFFAGQKNWWNRTYRRLQDRYLARRHAMSDYLFDLSASVKAGTLDRILRLSLEAVVEVETHPARPDEYSCLVRGTSLFTGPSGVALAPRYVVRDFRL